MQELLNIKKLYYEPKTLTFARGKEIFDKYPDSEKIPITTDHNKIPDLNKDETNLSKWNQVKENVLVLALKRGITIVPGERSCDFAPPSPSDGCSMACVYCYVARRKGYANPITIFANIDKIIQKVSDHSNSIGPKLESTIADPTQWIYDFGGSSDLSVDDLICDNVKDLITAFKSIEHSKLTFSTKYVNYNLLNYDPQHKTRIRFSLMPQKIATIIDVRTSKIVDRIMAINEFYKAGYDVDINLAPVVYYDGWESDYQDLLNQIKDLVHPDVLKQINMEIIFLTHNEKLHYMNLEWHPKAEDLLWRPELQAKKMSQFNKMINYRYKVGFKKPWVNSLVNMVNTTLPTVKIRYAF